MRVEEKKRERKEMEEVHAAVRLSKSVFERGRREFEWHQVCTMSVNAEGTGVKSSGSALQTWLLHTHLMYVRESCVESTDTTDGGFQVEEA